ncbi:FecCD family ABC transporter permease [Anaeromicropila herbilytica]|uniref:Corrinoid ABC transporter permease n=1 Tax=Anaeromicropila herbilytica TaxID=2785025 RepID=A0A7R7IBH6_9FIRM|nr:iron ABC transporter permease [Anaeromicropila herbilytica]BCN28789.1 corrinoid ABC transporter permease [Anaeromicropila herbilytica]
MKKRNRVRVHGVGFLLIIILALEVILSASVGSANLSFFNSLKIIIHRIPVIGNFYDLSDVKEVYIKIVWDIRMPRILLAGLTGCALSVVGASFQGLFKNPLADPHILGVSSGAAVGATIAMLSGMTMSFMGLGVIGIFAFLGALITVFIVYQIACVGNKISTVNIVLTGTAVSMMLSAVISLLMAFHHDQIEKVYLWTMGSFSSATWQKVSFMSFFTLVGIVGIFMFAKELDVMTIGNDSAKSLGIDTSRVKKYLIILASLLVAACVSVSGIIGFVGLVIPHCIRLISGPKHKRLLPFSALGGAIFMIFCDTIARTITAPSELPVGVITAILGTPYFIYLLQHNKRKLGA